MVRKIFIAFIVIVAVIAGIYAISANHDTVARVVMFRDFFDMALPILAFGALVKYLCSCGTACRCGCMNDGKGNCNSGCSKCCK